VRIVQADALSSDLGHNAFDLVHERLVMVNISAQEQLLSAMISLARPGGAVILEDIDNNIQNTLIYARVTTVKRDMEVRRLFASPWVV
jgi:hypothetical protein